MLPHAAILQVMAGQAGHATRPRLTLFACIERFDNAKRTHATIGHISPVEFGMQA